MKYYIQITLFCSCFNAILLGQNRAVEFNAQAWKIVDSSMTFADHQGRNSLKISGRGEAILQNTDFENGTIEFDYFPTGRGFCGIYFRRGDGIRNSVDFESEFFYLRAFKLDDPMVSGAVQYAPIIKGTNLWDLLHDYEANANIKSEQWNKVKLVISQKQMKCYLNDDLVLWIPEILGTRTSGQISLQGVGIYSNFKINLEDTEGLVHTAGADVTLHDVRYLRNWEYTTPVELQFTSNAFSLAMPDSNTTWNPIQSERFGLVNLTRHVASPFAEGNRQMVWMKTTIQSDKDQVKVLNMGFSDDIWVFLNNRFVFTDMNTYAEPIQKNPNGRLHIENTSFELPLQEGTNEIVIGLANNFFGWALMARLRDTNGINSKM